MMMEDNRRTGTDRSPFERDLADTSMFQVKHVEGKQIKLPKLDSLNITNNSNEDMELVDENGKVRLILKPGDNVKAEPTWEITLNKNIVVPSAIEFAPVNIEIPVHPPGTIEKVKKLRNEFKLTLKDAMSTLHRPQDSTTARQN